MESAKKNAIAGKLSQPIDPRIDSPQIKVVYPAPPMVLKDLPEEEPAVQPSPPTEPSAQLPTGMPVQQTANSTGQTTNPNPAPTGWQETIKQNSMLFIIVGLLALGIGFILGKKHV